MINNDLFQVLQALGLPGDPDEILLAIAFDVARAHIGVIAGQRRNHIVDSEPISREPLRPRRHVILTLEAADSVDLRNAWDVTQLRLDDPILKRSDPRRGRCQ